jgi:DnaJ domain
MATKKIFEGLGPGTLIPQRGKLSLDDPETLSKIGPEQAFVLSRVDGHTSLQEICMLVPFEEPVTMVILRNLWEMGAIDVAGVARTMVVPAPPPSTGSTDFDKAPPSGLKRRPVDELDNIQALAPPITTPPAEAADAPGLGMTAAQKKRIDDFFANLDQRNAFELLEIDRTADEKAVKRAYFKLSKEFHPDRYFGREIGEYKDHLSTIFRAIKAAFEVLSDKRRRAAYEEAVGLK